MEKNKYEDEDILTEEGKEKMLEDFVTEALNTGMFSVNSMRLKGTYPKSFKEMTNFLTASAGEQVVNEDVIHGSLLYSARNILYGFFDSKKIYVNVSGNANHEFNLNVVGSDSGVDIGINNVFSNRALAEVAAFNQAFDILEKSL